MRNTSFSYNIYLLCVIVFVFSCIVPTSCIKNADDIEPPEPPITDSTPTTPDSTLVLIDSVFMASVEYMHGEWMAQYIGYDPQQSGVIDSDVVSAIRRMFYFSPEGFYENHVQGIVNIEDTITIYKEFEHEYGMYAFDVERQMMTYTVEYDSLLNFDTDQLEYHAGKMMGQQTLPQYGEKIWFSYESDGKRDWIRTDGNLMSVDDHSAQLIYKMKNSQ